jgi:hypothetical protein
MAKRARPRRKTGTGTYQEAMKALKSAGVPIQEFGGHNPDGTINIDHKVLEALQKKLKKGRRKHVRFVALNAPFKRRSPVAPA